jgi:hypothetical protein
MSEQERYDQLNDAIESLRANGGLTPTGDADIDGMASLAARLRALPDDDFKERLHQELFPGGSRPAILQRLRLPSWQALARRPALVAPLALGVIALFAAAGIAGWLLLAGGDNKEEVAERPDEIEFAMVATQADAIGVEPDTDFVLTSVDPTNAAFVRSVLHVEPAVELRVEEEDSRRFLVEPAAPLEPGKAYRFELVDTSGARHVLASFAFQTKSAITVVQTLPRGQATGVPTNTGIELTFSHEGVQDIESHFRIDPPVAGRFEVHKRVIVFVPEELAPGTLYTVTVTAGLGVAGTTDTMVEDFAFQFETGATQRTGDVPFLPVVNFSRRTSEASTLEAPALQVFGSQTDLETLPFEVYRYPDRDAFLAALGEFQRLPSWAQVTRDGFLSDTSALEQVATFDVSPQRLGDFGQSFVQFPEPLPEGFYLVQTELEGRAAQSWLQVTDVATYVAVSEGQVLVWVNDLRAPGPLAGARLEITGTDASADTDADGAAVLDTPAGVVSVEPSGFGYSYKQTNGNLMVTAPDGRSAVVPLTAGIKGYVYGGYYASGYTTAGDDYWHYISSDRPLYLPTDTIRFWGVARQRENPQPKPLTVELTSSDYFDYYYRPVRVAEVDVTTTALGTFSGELSFEGVSPGYYSLTVRSGDEVIDSLYVPIETYTKPAYRIDVVPDRQAVFAGEPVTFSVRASFLEGSPVPGLRLRYSGEVSGELTTDDQGEARVTVSSASKSSTSYASSIFLSLTPVLAEEAEIIGEAWVTVLPGELMISAATADLEDGQGVIEGTVHHVDLSRINSGASQGYDDYLGEPASNTSVAVQITEQSWRQREVGEYYDFIAKIVRKRYEYDQIETPLGTFSATTDASGAFRYAFPAEEEKYYHITASVTDGAGRVATYETYVSGSRSLFNARSNLVYLGKPGGSNDFFGGSDTYGLGDEVKLEMRRGAELLPAGGDSRYLFYKARDGIRDHFVQSDSTLSFAVSEDDVPNTEVLGVWFNGRTYMEVRYSYHVAFDKKERELTIGVTPDKERYGPGDTATLDVLVTDRSGEPQEGVEVNLAVVDEAIFLIQGPYTYNTDALDSLYRPVGAGILHTYASHQYPNEEQPAERGGDGGARREFADAAFYGQVTTDSEGHASVTFDLPDNLTSWRVTAQAFSDEIEAGTAIHQLPVGLPFFVDVTMSHEYLLSDRPAIKVRSFGRDLQAGQQVTFEVTAPSLGLTEPARVTAGAFAAASVPLPELRLGEHEITVSGASGLLSDSLVRTIRVVPSRLVRGESNFYELEDGLDVEGASDGPTKLVFSDHERGRYLPLLQQLSWESGDRVDQMLARDLTAQLLVDYFEEVEARGEPFDASLYQTPDGGIALFPYADDDLALSARVAALAPERVGATTLSKYFLAVTENRDETRERGITALYGLAALGEPVLVPVQALVQESDLSWRERLYLGLAAHALGDDTTAGEVLQELLDDFGESREPNWRLRVGTDQDDILEATSLAAILAAGVGDPLAPALFDYTRENYTTDIIVELEQISYLAEALPRLSSEPLRFAYTINGERHEVALERGESLTVQVSADELAGLDVDQIEGRAGVASLFTVPVEAEDFPRDTDVSVTRSYADATGEPVVLQDGELVRIFLNADFGPQALDGCYQLTDLLPSGLKPVARPHAWGADPGISYPYRIDGQRVSFCVYKDTIPKGAAYYARVVSEGTYTVEPAVIQSMQSTESANLSAPLEVVIE